MGLRLILVAQPRDIAQICRSRKINMSRDVRPYQRPLCGSATFAAPICAGQSLSTTGSVVL